MEINQNELWVTERLALIEPEWQPDLARARDRLELTLQARLSPRIVSPWAIAAATVALTCIVFAAIPQTRAKAQELWAHFMVNRVDVVRLDLSDLPLESHVSMSTISQPARDLTEAEHIAGFQIHLPTGVLSSAPRVSVTGTMFLEQTIHVAKLETALRKLNTTDVTVAPEWDGVTLRAVIGPLVAADYPGEIEILQSPPISLTIPSGFPLERFAETAFRSIGVSERDAAPMAHKFAENPAWLLDIPPDEPVNVQELSLTSGPALLVEDFDDHGAVARDTVIRSTTTRIYSVASPNRDLSVKIANALP